MVFPRWPLSEATFVVTGTLGWAEDKTGPHTPNIESCDHVGYEERHCGARTNAA